MSDQSLKNLNSFSRGYIEDYRTKQQFGNTFVGTTATLTDNSTTIKFTQQINPKGRRVRQKAAGFAPTSLKAGYQVSCKLDDTIQGVPRILEVLNVNDVTHIIVDIPQTIPAGTTLVMSDANLGLSKYELTGNTLNRSKEDIRINDLIPDSVLEYSSQSTRNNNTGGIQPFLNSYYHFMNTEQFVYRQLETFEDIVINGVATFRINDPGRKNNRFFSEQAAKTANYYDSNNNPLIVGSKGFNILTNIDVDTNNIQISNLDDLPSETALDNNSGRTLSIYNLPVILNNKKIKIEIYVQYFVGANPSYRLNTLEDALNINENEEVFLDMMQKEIAPAIDKNIKVNKRALYQRLIDFYKIKGSASSIDTFFKLFFENEEIAINYPWESTLKPSMGNYDSATAEAATYTRQTATVTASDNGAGTAANAEFGTSVSIYSKTNLLAVGAPGDNSDKGAVYVYGTTNNGIEFAADAAGNNPDGKIVGDTAGDKFGSKISLYGNYIAISSPGDNGYNGGTEANSGSVEIWERVLTSPPSTFTWIKRQKIIAPTGPTGGLKFGDNVALYDNILAISAPGYVNANQSNGAVYIYKGVGSIWSLSQIITPPLSINRAGENGWPSSIALEEDYLVAAWAEYDENRGVASAFYLNPVDGIYREEATGFSETKGQKLGSSIDIDVEGTLLPTVAIGCEGSREVQIWQRSTFTTGAARWDLVDSMKPSFNQSDDKFAADVIKIYDDNLFVGAANSIGMSNVTNSGLVYHFQYKNNIWLEVEKYHDSEINTIANNQLGLGFDITRRKNITPNLLIGIPGPDTGGSFNGRVNSYTRELSTGKYLDNESFLSDKQKLQDSEFYQKFSYVIKSGQNVSKWKNVYNKLVHPAGFKYFGEILLVLKGTRDILGDDRRRVSVLESELDELTGLSSLASKTVIAHSASADFRKTMSAMPGIQSGYIGNEDLGLLIEIFSAFFSPFGVAKTNKSAKLSISAIDNGSISGVRIVEPGAGYISAPTITGITLGSGGTIETKINRFGSVIDVILKGTLSTVESTAASQTTFKFDNNTADSGRDAAVYDNLVVTGGSGSGAKVKITVDANKKVSKIQGVSGHLGTGYKVGDTLTVAAGSLESSGTDSGAFSFSVAKIINGTGYSSGSGISVQGLSDVTGSGVATAIGRTTNTATITLASNPLTAGRFYKITDLGNATPANFDTIASAEYDGTDWSVGDIFEAANPGSNLSTTAKLVEFASGIEFSPFTNKKYKSRPIITIGEPDRLSSDGSAFETNVQATAIFKLDTEIPLDNTERLLPSQRYTIVDLGNATVEQINRIAMTPQSAWAVGETFTASSTGNTINDDNSATTAFVVPYDSPGKITRFIITNPGLGYITNPDVSVTYAQQSFKVPDVIPIKIVTNGNNVQRVSAFGSVRNSKIISSIDRTNDYFSRKDYGTKAILGTKRFQGEFTIEQFSSLSIENVGESDINKNNINTLFSINDDRNT